jgi:8-oxo-dGTP diphosphatase
MYAPGIEAMAMNFDDYPKPALAVDPAVLTVADGRAYALLWRRANAPHESSWALPGVFVNLEESFEQAVARGLMDKLGLAAPSYVEQLFTWNRPHRDDRGWVVAVAYFALIPAVAAFRAAQTRSDVCLAELKSSSRNKRNQLLVCGPDGETSLAFDHQAILGSVLDRVQGKLDYVPLAFELLPKEFTLRELQLVHEALLGRRLNKDSFRKRIMHTLRWVEPTGRFQTDVGHRPAELYRRSRRAMLTAPSV